MATSTRIARLESQLQREIAICVQQEIRDPRMGFVTVLRVKVSSDLSYVKAYWSILGDQKQKRLAEQALEHARGFVQARYAKVLHTRVLPQLSWEYDDSDHRRAGMDDLIRRARTSDTDGGAKPEPPAAQLPPGLVPPPIAPTGPA
jgi:ribosome-binding factor A